MTDKRILLIDDEETIQEVVQVGLDLEVGWEVLSASSGKEGIAMAQKQKPDVILLDVMMPEMDGIETFKNLQADPDLHELPVILLTAKVQATDKLKFKEIGVTGYISKPFNPVTLADEVAQILGW